jgi:hypothetical protein
VHVQAYSFTSQPIARALTDAEKRGVKVIAILDASNRTKNYSAFYRNYWTTTVSAVGGSTSAASIDRPVRPLFLCTRERT